MGRAEEPGQYRVPLERDEMVRFHVREQQRFHLGVFFQIEVVPGGKTRANRFYIFGQAREIGFGPFDNFKQGDFHIALHSKLTLNV